MGALVDYHDLVRVRPVAERFVYSPFCHGTGCPSSVLSDLLHEGAKVLVAASENWPDLAVPHDRVKLSGFVIVAHGQLAWLYVKDVQLPQADGTLFRLRGKGLGKALLAAAGFLKTEPVPVLFDVPAARSAAERFNRRGWRITFPSDQQERQAR